MPRIFRRSQFMIRNSRLISPSGTKNKRLLFKVVKTNWTHNNSPFLGTTTSRETLTVLTVLPSVLCSKVELQLEVLQRQLKQGTLWTLMAACARPLMVRTVLRLLLQRKLDVCSTWALNVTLKNSLYQRNLVKCFGNEGMGIWVLQVWRNLQKTALSLALT